mmetsp:Transcript_27685/g.62750  ORF Transcript_27685/g.62750 Transcript_27685/m.62750 type:complete len:153 (+) Transcript_27685:2-460(+)
MGMGDPAAYRRSLSLLSRLLCMQETLITLLTTALAVKKPTPMHKTHLGGGLMHSLLAAVFADASMVYVAAWRLMCTVRTVNTAAGAGAGAGAGIGAGTGAVFVLQQQFDEQFDALALIYAALCELNTNNDSNNGDTFVIPQFPKTNPFQEWK